MQDCSSPSLTAIVKPTYACNLGCLYCYEGGRAHPQERMSLETLRNVITSLAQYHGSGRTTHIIWHGGEPLLMGLDFFRAAIKIQQEMGAEYEFDNSIQTNGTLLTDEVLDFFQENHFSIGTSLDGPDWLNNFTRPYQDGSPSFEDILRAIMHMRKRWEKRQGRANGGGCIAILTKAVLPHLDEFYEFFRDNRINLKVNPIFYAGRGATMREKLGITPQEYGEAMVYLFDRWFYEPEHIIDIDPFDLILGNLMTGDPWGCQFGPACWDSFISVDPMGNVHPCGRWSSEDQFCMGNLNQQTIDEIRQSPVLEEFRRERAKALLKCQSCEFRPICNSGCVENGYLLRQRLSDRDIYCAGYKKIFSYVRDALLRELAKATITETNSDEQEKLILFDKPIAISKIENPALRRVIEHRLFSTKPSNWNEHERWRKTYQDYQEHRKHEKYAVYYEHKEHRQKYNEVYNDRHTQRYGDHREYSDHNYPMC